MLQNNVLNYLRLTPTQRNVERTDAIYAPSSNEPTILCYLVPEYDTQDNTRPSRSHQRPEAHDIVSEARRSLCVHIGGYLAGPMVQRIVK